MYAFHAILIFALSINVFVWSYVFGQGHRDRLNRSFLLFVGWTSGWTLLELSYALPATRGFEWWIVRGISVLWIPMGLHFLRFAYALIERPPDRYYRAATVLTLALVAVALSTELVLTGFVCYPWAVVDVRGPAHAPFAFVVAAIALGGLVIIGQASFQQADEQRRRSLRIVLVGGVVALASVLGANVVPDFLGATPSVMLGSSTLSIFCLFVYWAVQRHNFMRLTVEGVAEEIFADVRDGLVIVNEAGIIRRMSAAARDLLAHHRLEPTGCSEEACFGRRLPGGAFSGVEIALPAEDATRHLLVSGAPLVEGGRPLGRVLLLRDISARREIEAELERDRAGLEQEVQEMTSELRHAQKMEAIATLADGIAHDFNNLLGAMMGFANAARDEAGSSSELVEDMKDVLESTQRARALVRQLLSFSGERENDAKEVDVGGEVNGALKTARFAIPDEISIEWQLPSKPLFVRGDPLHVSQIIANLVNNAWQAMPEGGTLEVRADGVEVDAASAREAPPLAPGPHVRLSVSDTGVGMDEETLAKVFEPFFTTKQTGSGTGLGLASVAKVVKEMGGTVRVTSKLGAGTTFWVYLPRVGFEVPPERAKRSAAVGGPERILVVDDEEKLLRMYRRLLEPLGYKLRCMSNSFEAWLHFRDHPDDYDLVVTDQTMPEMCGTELATEILALRPALPIILASGYADAVSPEKARQLGLRKYVAKPLTKEDLTSAIREVLEDRPAPGDRSC